MKINPKRMLEQIQAKIDATSDPRHKALLRVAKEHVSAELDARSVDRIMATMVEEPRFHWWGMGYGDVGPKGREAVAAHYGKMTGLGYHLHQHRFDRIIVDDRNIVFEGPISIVFPGAVLQGMNIAVDDPDAHYLATYQSIAVFHFDEEGRCTGEDSYSDGMPITQDRIRKLAPDEVPEPVIA